MPSITEERLIALITNHLAGNLTEEEQLELNAWVQSGPGNAVLLSKLTDKESIRVEIERWKNIDPSAGYDKWLKALAERERGRILRIVRWAAAACVVGVLAVVWLMPKASRKDGAPSVAVTGDATILPGRNTAVLTLADGRRVLLDSVRNGTIAEQGNSKVQKLSNGELAYNGSQGKADEVMYNMVATPAGGEYQVTLPDGSRVWLNAASSIRFPTAFAGQERRVQVTGEAYFEVVHRSSQPFVVAVRDMRVQVLGTHFTINAYADEPAIKTTLLQGSVVISKGNQKEQLSPGQQAMVNNDGHIQITNAVDTSEVMAWKNGFFLFKKASIETIMRQAARWYDVEIEYQGPSINKRFYVEIPRSSKISAVFESLEGTGNVHFKIESHKVIVTKE